MFIYIQILSNYENKSMKKMLLYFMNIDTDKLK
jgi:hypothetical protein